MADLRKRALEFLPQLRRRLSPQRRLTLRCRLSTDDAPWPPGEEVVQSLVDLSRRHQAHMAMRLPGLGTLSLIRPGLPIGELSGRVALVTGAAGGIGSAIAQRFAQAGAQVVLTDLDGEGAMRAAAEIAKASEEGDCALGVKADATSEAETAQAVAATVLAYGGLDILVANAGIIEAAPIEATSLESWRRHLDVNLRGYEIAARAAIPVMQAQGGGAIVFNVSKGAFAPAVDNAPYCSAKAGAAHLARALAAELGPSGIRVNSFNADFVETPMLRRHLERRAAMKGVAYEEILPGYRDRNLLKVGPIPPAAVAEAALFLASDRAAYTTGSVITIDGGLADAMPR